MRAKSFLAALVFACGVSAAHADTFTFNFCPGNASCHADLTEASLTFATIDGSADANDYNLTIRFVGTLTNLFLDTIDFTAGLAMADMPVLTAAPAGTVLGDWTTRFDKLNASPGNNCSGTMANQKFACSKATTGNGPDFAGTNDWMFLVDFAGDGLISADSDVDLRALWVNADGHRVGQMSPEGVVSTTTTETPTTSETPTTGDPTTGDPTTGDPTTGDPTTTGHVPEPAVLSLLGVALAGVARRVRKVPGRS